MKIADIQILDKNGKEINIGDKVICSGGEYSYRYIGTVKFGEFLQDGSGNEYPPVKIMGVYVKKEKFLSAEWDKEDFENWPEYFNTVSILEIKEIEVI